MIFDTMQCVFKMQMLDPGPLNLTEFLALTDEGMKACHQYAKNLSGKL